MSLHSLTRSLTTRLGKSNDSVVVMVEVVRRRRGMKYIYIHSSSSTTTTTTTIFTFFLILVATNELDRDDSSWRLIQVPPVERDSLTLSQTLFFGRYDDDDVSNPVGRVEFVLQFVFLFSSSLCASKREEWRMRAGEKGTIISEWIRECIRQHKKKRGKN